jgi:hypothetical protein
MGEVTETFKSWAVVELFGHQQIVGQVSEQTIAGQGFIRVDVPATERQPAFTRLFGAGAIYAINPVTEEIARKFVNYYEQTPIAAYELRALEPSKEREDEVPF